MILILFIFALIWVGIMTGLAILSILMELKNYDPRQ